MAYIATPEGIVIVDLKDPLKPVVRGQVGLPGARASGLQLNYLFVTHAGGLSLIDVSDPDRPQLLQDATVPLVEARGLAIARSWIYVASGAQGVAVIDAERPLKNGSAADDWPRRRHCRCA